MKGTQLLLGILVLAFAISSSEGSAQTRKALINHRLSGNITLPPAQGVDCSSDQRLDSAARRREAIVRARSVNTLQAQQWTKMKRYATAEELGLKDDNGFEVSLRTDTNAYMLFIRDATDPCSSGVFSDQRGVIYTVQPIR